MRNAQSTLARSPLSPSIAAIAVALLFCAIMPPLSGRSVAFGTVSYGCALMAGLLIYLHARFADHVRLVIFVEALALAVLAAAVLGILSYLASAANWPLRDEELASVDRLLGFDWYTFVGWADRFESLVWSLGLAYDTHSAQVILALAVLSFTSRTDDLDSFLLALLTVGLLTILISAAVPAIGPAGIPSGKFHHVTLSGATPAHVLASLRSGALRIIDLDHMRGVVTFPSFHAAIAVIVPWFLRRWNAILWPILLLDAAMLVSTLTEGGHYLADVLAGSALAAFSICVVAAGKRRLARRSAHRQPTRPATPAAELSLAS